MEDFVQISKNIVTQIVDDNILILEKTGKNIILLNSTASKIFKYIDKGYDFTEIVDMLQQEYFDEHNSIKSDVEDIFKYFFEKGIIVCLNQ